MERVAVETAAPGERAEQRPLCLALVGCGAVTENFHLPVVTRSSLVEPRALVDKNEERAGELSARWGIEDTLTDAEALEGDVDAAIVAVPHHLHATISTALLRRGIHVLVEKPMALSGEECREMIAAARGSGATLAVGLVRRFYRNSRYVKRILDQGMLGPVRSFRYEEGGVFDWDVASASAFSPDASGGVLWDTGAHVLDLLTWWLGECRVADYRDDAFGGVEAECELELALPGGGRGRVLLSRLRKLSNSVRIEGEKGAVRTGTGWNDPVRLAVSGSELALEGEVCEGKVRHEKLSELFDRQLEDFVEAVRTGRDPLVSGEDASRSVELISRCGGACGDLIRPWDVAHRDREVEAGR